MFSVFENFQVFFRKKTYLFPKNSTFWTSSDHMSNSEFRDAFGKKNAKLSVFEKVQNSFFQDIYLFFQRRPKSESFESSWTIINFGTHSRWIRKDYCFWKLASTFSNIPFFLQKATSFERFENFLSNNTFRNALFWKIAKVCDFSKKIELFFQKKTSFFQKIQILNVLRIPKH